MLGWRFPEVAQGSGKNQGNEPSIHSQQGGDMMADDDGSLGDAGGN